MGLALHARVSSIPYLSASRSSPPRLTWSLFGGLALAFACSCGSAESSGPSSPAPASPLADAGVATTARPPAADPVKWRNVRALAKARLCHTATLLADGRVLVVGGEDAARRMLDTTEIYDPATETWTAGPKLPAPRSNHAAVRLPDGRVLVMGGGKSTPTGQPLGEGVMADALFFDVRAESVEPAPSMQNARSHFQMASLPSGDVLVIGGAGSEQYSPADCKNAPYCGPFGKATATVERFDVASNVWSSVAPMNEARTSFAAASLSNGRVVATGGLEGSGAGTRTTEMFDPVSGAWTRLPDMVGPVRQHHSATSTGDGAILVVGGKNPNVRPLASTEIYDEASGKWRDGPSLDEARTSPGMVRLESGRVAVIGGFAQLASLRDEPGNLREVLIFEASAGGGSGKLTKVADLAVGRVLFTTTLLADGRVLVAGGIGDAGALGSAELGEP